MQAGTQRGFTILEVLVAFLLATMLLSLILSGFSTGLSGLSRTERTAQAALVAQSRLAELGVSVPLGEGQYGGVTEDSQIEYRWQVSVRPFEWGYADVLRDQGLEMYRVDVDVFWPAAMGEHQYQLATFRTLAGTTEPALEEAGE